MKTIAILIVTQFALGTSARASELTARPNILFIVCDDLNTHVTTSGHGPSGLRDQQHKDGKNVRQIASWLDNKACGDKPFFIVGGIQKPHVPFLAPDAYFALYPKDDLSFRLTPMGFWNQAPRLAMVRRYKSFGFDLGVENDPLRREYT